TLVTSYHQFTFFIENNINSVSLPNELFINEIKQICEHKPNNFELLIQTQGFAFIMHSRWNLVSNFQKYVDDKNKEYDANKIIFIKELNKVYPNLIIEDEFGTHMFSGYELCCIKFLKEFQKINLDYLLIDTYLNNNSNYDLEIYKIYQQAKNDLDNLDKYFMEIKEITKNELSSGFIGGPLEIKHLLKKENHDEK
ncbi:MAG: U32 family peptidase, partial [Ureaplasma sp.]|nr:U32 family peptidase [Ureaplasma sp.]